MTDRRNHLRRSINALAMRDGDYHEAKMFSSAGKGLVIWLIWKHADMLIQHYDAMIVLFAFLIVPDVIKKMLTMKLGAKHSPLPD